MSLNADVMDDIDNSQAIDNDLIKPPTPAGANKNPITIVAKSNDVKANVTQLQPEELSKLPNLDVKFQLVKDNVNRVVELQDVESDILSQESISRTDAVFINDVFKGLLGNSLKLEEFTQSPTKTNYLFVKNFMRLKISQEQLNTIANFKTFLDEPLKDAKAVLAKLKDFYIGEVTYNFRNINSKAQEDLDNLMKNKNMVVAYESEFKNLSTIPFTVLDFSKVKLPLPIDGNLNQAVSNINNLLLDKTFNSFIFGSLDGKSALDCVSRDSMVEYSGHVLDAVTLFKVFTSMSILDNIEQLSKNAEQIIKYIETVEEESTKDKYKDDYTEINKFLIQNNLEIQNMIKSVKTICNIVLSTGNLVMNAEALIDFYKKM
jgi:hypothetical protein